MLTSYIGSGYFWTIVGTEKLVIPSGLSLIPSKIGYILTGRYNDTDTKSCHLSLEKLLPHFVFPQEYSLEKAMQRMADNWEPIIFNITL